MDMEFRNRSKSPTLSLSTTKELSTEDNNSRDEKQEDSLSFSSSSNEGSSEEEAQQLSEDLETLDANEKDAERKMVYKNSKLLFLMQSTLLGISYSIIWPTLWTYITEEFALSHVIRDLAYGLTYVAYPVGSMLSAYLVENINLSTKHMVLLLNTFEIVGNLTYTLAYFPGLPVIGRFVAGLGDAFYVVLMKEMKSSTGIPDEKMTIECLAAFIIGVVLSPGINILTTFLQFKFGSWHLNANTYPGLSISVLFLLMQFLILIFLKDTSKKDGTSNAFKSTLGSSYTSRFIEVTNLIKESPYTIWYVNGYAFLYTYIVAMLELLTPFIMYELLNSSQREVMILYAVIATVYAMLLMMTMTVTFDYQPETFFCLSVLFQIVGLFAVIYFTWLGPYHTVSDVLAMGAVVIALTALWSSDDVLFINFVQIFIPFHQREQTHTARKFTSKIAFAIAGVTVPFMYKQALLFVAPLLVVVVCFMFIMFVIIRFFLLKKGM